MPSSSSSLRKRTVGTATQNSSDATNANDNDDSSSDDPLVVIPSCEENSKGIKANTITEKPAALHKKKAPWFFIRILQSYTKFLQSSSNQDRGLKLLQYTLWLASHVYKKESAGRDALKKLSFDVSFARYATRLLQLPTALEAVMTDSWVSHSPNYPALFRFLGRALAVSMVGYYPAEHAAYLHWMAPAWLAKGRSAERLSAISCRCWLVYIVAETLQCILQWRELVQKQQQNRTEEQEENKQKTSSELTNVKLQLTRNLFFILPCIHWSLPNWDRQPWLPGKLVDGLMWAESVLSLFQSVRSS